MRLFNKKRYSSDEEKQINVLQNSARETFGEALNGSVLFSPERREGKLYATHYNSEALIDVCGQLGQGRLATLSYDLLNHITTYLEQRENRFFWNSGYSDEPIVLFCLIFRTALRDFTKRTSDQALLSDLEAWSKYLTRLIVSRCFSAEKCQESPSRFGLKKESKTFYWILSLSHQYLSEMIKVVSTQIAAARSREHFENLISNTEFYLSLVVKFLFFVFRGDECIPDFTENAFSSSETQLYVDYRRKMTGQCMRVLLSEKKRIVENDSLKENVFYEKGQSRMPSSVEYIDLSNKDWRSWLTLKERTGFFELFNTESVWLSYLSLCGLLLELSKLNRLWSKAFDLAGEGGDFLIYCTINPEMRRIFLASEALIASIQEKVNRLFEHGRSRFNIQSELNQTLSNWRRNFECTYQFIDSMRARQKEILTKINLLKREMESMTHENRRIKLEKMLENFHENSRVFLEGAGIIFNSEFIPPSLTPAEPLSLQIENQQSKSKLDRLVSAIDSHYLYLSSLAQGLGIKLDMQLLKQLSNDEIEQKFSGTRLKRWLALQLRLLKQVNEQACEHRASPDEALSVIGETFLKNREHWLTLPYDPKLVLFLEILAVLTLGLSFAISLLSFASLSRGKYWAFWRSPVEEPLQVYQSNLTLVPMVS